MKILYSINTWLAYKVSQVYYNNKHYVWCAPFFNANGDNPPSSDPSKIYKTIADDVIGNDKHSAKIAQNRTGIIRGAEIKLGQGIINKDQYEEVIIIASKASLMDFRPLVYVIPYNLVEDVLQKVAIEVKANHFSQEFIIEDLTTDQFDIMDLLNL